ncbi:MAG: FtsH protease activity modulator HflK [Lachnospiraceae bacterium]|nr:FtsH protease activity modulator HflK [Lachnospiraceae bacterium]
MKGFDFHFEKKDPNVVDEAGTGLKFGRAAKIILLLAAAAVIIFSGFYKVSEQENAVITMFGRVVRTDTAGLYFKIPFLQKVRYVDITTHGTGVGYTLDNEGQNITDEANGIMITSDFNLLDIDFYLEYRVSDPVAYLYASDDPEEILKNIALSSIRSVVADFTVDEAMTTAKGQIQANVKEDMTRELNEHDVGLAVVNITVQDSEPPTDEIKQAFKAVETAKQGADTAKNNALAYQNEQLPRAEANADKIVQSAEADKAARIAEAEGQVVRFNEMYEQYKLYPYITKKRMFYETMEELLPSVKVIISDGGTQTLMPLDSFSGDTEPAEVQIPEAGQTEAQEEEGE